MAVSILVLVCVVGFSLAACADERDGIATISGSPPPEDRGDFKLTIEAPEDEADADAAAFVKEAGTVQAVVKP